jgi:DNA-binding Lrp family transcriptional regulator
MIEVMMTNKELILNFINQYDLPFNAEVIAKLTSVSKEAVEKLLPELLQSQAIKQIEDGPPIYVRANRFQARIGYQHYKGWTFSIADAHRLLDILEQGRYKSIREIAQAIGKSRQWVYIYLEALTSIEVIDLRQYVYVVISRQNVPKIGRKVQKGILGQLRSLNRIGCYRMLD